MAEIKKETLQQYVEEIAVKPNGIARFVTDFFSQRHKLLSVPQFHLDLYNLLLSSSRLAIAAPRSFAKTTVVDVYYLVFLALFRFPLKDNIVLFSVSQTFSIEQIKRIRREFEHNEPLREFYRIIWGKPPHDPLTTWREDEIEFSNGARIQARGAGQQARGKRPNVVVCDDLESTEGVRSPEQRKYLDEWFRKDILGMLEPTSQIVVIGTILHYDSLLKNIIDEMPECGWHTVVYQAYNDGVQEPGHELWVEKWSHEDLQKRKAEQGSAYFSAEYMNDPISQDTAIFLQENIRYYKDLPDKYSCVMVLDPAYSERGTSDFKVAVVIAIDDKNNRYVVDRFRTKAAENDYINGSLNMFLRYKNRITYFGMPKGREVDFYNKVLELATSRRVFLPHIEIKNVSKSVTGVSERNKKARITMTLQALFQQGKYYLQETHQDIVDELLHHPYGKHDDLIDAMTGAEQILMPVYFEVEEKSEFAPSIKIERGDSGYGI